jgi:hypothetical protein
MQNQGLLFIPDISGFTRFVTEMEIEHSRHIIQELLETLIEANQLGLEISEIEGDAILFYQFGPPPELDTVYSQVAHMFCAFHRHLLSYETRRFCQCKACTTAIDLSLKVITHYGEFTGYTVKNFSKLIGRDVIVAHQLLKNNIEHHEYWLGTTSLLGNNPPASLTQWMQWRAGNKQTEHGTIPFYYAQLTELKQGLEPELTSPWELPNKLLALSVTREFNTDIKTLFYTTAHLEFRSQWQEGVKTIDQVSQYLPGVGTSHRRVLERGHVRMYTSSFEYDPEQRIVFSETDEHKRSAVYFILRRTGDNTSTLTLELYLANKAAKFIFDLFMKKQRQGRFERSMLNLERVLQGIRLPVEF